LAATTTPRLCNDKPSRLVIVGSGFRQDGTPAVSFIPQAGGAAVQVTTEPSHKTQPAWSPDGTQIAFTVWSYDAQFWRTR